MRHLVIGTAALAVLCVQIGPASLSARAGEVISGHPIVVDGDTLRLRGVVIGLSGIAAPGLDQTCEGKGGPVPCGRRSAEALARRIGEAVTTCTTSKTDRAHRQLATCRLGDVDLSGWMVSSGFAVSERFSDRTYFSHETEAWAKRRGLWAGVFEDPTDRPRADYSLAEKVAELPPESSGRTLPEEHATVRLGRLAKSDH